LTEDNGAVKQFKPSLLYILLFRAGLAVLLFGALLFLPNILVLSLLGFGWAVLLLGVVVLVFAAVSFYSYYWWKNAVYELWEDGVFKKTGVFSRSQALFLYEQIQNVKENARLLDLLFGVKHLKMVTMSGSSSASGTLEGLSAGDARELRDAVVQKINSLAALKAKPSPKRSSAPADRKKVEVSGVLPSAPTFEGATAPFELKRLQGFAAVALFYFVVVFVLSFAFFLTQNDTKDFAGAAALFFSLFCAVCAGFVSAVPYSYSLGRDWMQVKYAFLQESAANCRYDRIQDVVISEPFYYRLFGIASLKVETGEQLVQENNAPLAGLEIPALSARDAFALKDLLLKKAGITEKQQYEDLRKQFDLEAVKPLKKTVAGTAYAIAIVLGLLIAINVFFKDFAQQATWLLGAAIALVVIYAVAAFAYHTQYYWNYEYKTTRNVLKIRKGVFGFVTVYVPYSRVQNVFVDMDIFDRLFGLRDTHLSTIGFSSVREMHVDGLNATNSEGLKNFLLDAVRKNRA
jgi:uncharacterized membrane protein YdbT with pleckstrin-like domain